MPALHLARLWTLLALLGAGLLASACTSKSDSCSGGICPEDRRERTPQRPGSRDNEDVANDESDSTVETDPPPEEEEEEGVVRRGGEHGWDPAGLIGVVWDDDGVQVAGAGTVSDIFWIPNTGESSVSRWNAATGQEEARYFTGYPNGASDACLNVCCWTQQCNMPSRVVVDDAGDAYVANRGFGMQASITKIAGDRSRCIDRDSTGEISTSTGPQALPWPPGNDMLSFIPNDDCVLWTVPVPPGENNGTPRAIAVDIGDKGNPRGYLWVSAEAQRRFYRLNLHDGEIVDVVHDLPIHPYGAIVMPDGRLWYHALNGGIAWIDTETLEVSDVIPPPVGMRSCPEADIQMLYGVTADSNGRLWYTGLNCPDVLGFDTRTEEWTIIPGVAQVNGQEVRPFQGMHTGRGITVDIRGRVWLALATTHGGGGQSSFAVFDADLFNPGGTITEGIEIITIPVQTNAPSGIAVDSQGRVWLGHFEESSALVVYDPAAPAEQAFQSFTGFNRVYTYSDFTGAVRRNTIGRGLYREVVDLGCDHPTDVTLSWSALTPDGTEVVLTAESAESEALLNQAPTVDIARLPPQDEEQASLSAIFDEVDLPLQRWLRLDITLVLGDRLASPTLRALTVEWECP